jgi:hypothetical protein
MSDEDREEDPFERLDADADREGDPFERLGTETDEQESADDADDEVDNIFEETVSTPNTDVADVFEDADESAAGQPPAASDESGTVAEGGDDPDETPAPFFESGDDTGETSRSGGAEESGATDPFEQALDPTETPSRDSSAADATETVDATDATDTDRSAADPEATSATDPDDPFTDMDAREGDPFEGGESAFERVDVGGVDADSVWEEITSEDEEESTPDLGEMSGSPDAEVSKHRYCEQCEFFSAPPDVGCSHDEAQILEFVDMETVRLRNCPVVAEQRELDDEQ